MQNDKDYNNSTIKGLAEDWLKNRTFTAKQRERQKHIASSTEGARMNYLPWPCQVKLSQKEHAMTLTS